MSRKRKLDTMKDNAEDILDMELKDIPEIRIAENHDTGEKFVLFYGASQLFSNLYPCNFKIDGVDFNCTEQYFHYKKAELFDDKLSMEEILKSKDGKNQKSLGRKVKNFDKDLWERRSEKIMKDGNRAKYQQNEKVRKKLLETVSYTLVEASPRDTKWGIGFAKDNPKAINPSQWRGRNLMGQALTQIRDELSAGKEVCSSNEESSISAPAEGMRTVESPEKLILFYGETPFLSNFSPSVFTLDGVRFNCTEQYFHYKKAEFCSDSMTMAKILTTESPGRQKFYGRRIKDYKNYYHKWQDACAEVMKEGNLAKYRQCPELRKQLFDTIGSTLVEASAKDCKWGIGLGLNNHAADDRKNWRGRNLLGQVLMDVRDQLVEEYKNDLEAEKED